MYISPNHHPDAMQSLQRQYAENSILPSIDWQSLSAQQQLTPAQITALDTIYQSAIPLALTVFKRLNFDVFAPAAFHPQGLGLFDQLAKQEERFIDILSNAAEDLDHDGAPAQFFLTSGHSLSASGRKASSPEISASSL